MEGLPTVGRVLVFLFPFYFFGKITETLLNTAITYVRKKSIVVVVIIITIVITTTIIISFP